MPDRPRIEPRGLRRDDAAAYVGVSLERFDALVAAGKLPQPFQIDEYVLWDRWKIDAGESPRDESNRLYLIQCAVTGIVKIGISANVKARHLALQASSPTQLTILLDVPGSRAIEAALHKRFRAKRRHGEWFTLSREDIQSIAESHEP